MTRDYKFSKDEGEARASIYNSCEKSAQVLLYRSPEVPSLGDLLDMLPCEQSTLHPTAIGAEQDFPALDILQQVKDAAAKIASIPSVHPCSGALPRWKRRRSAAATKKETERGLATRGEQGAEVEQAKLQSGEMKTFSEDEKVTGETASGTRRGAKWISLGKMELERKSKQIENWYFSTIIRLWRTTTKHGLLLQVPTSEHTVTLIGTDL